MQGSRIEILNAGGYRSDGRKQYELRTMSIALGATSLSTEDQRIHALNDPISHPHPTAADGTACVVHGLSEVCSRVFGPREALLRRETIHDRANLNVQVIILPFSGGMAGRRRGRNDKQVFLI